MVDLIWEATYGYGDILGAFANAQLHHLKSGEDVNLKFRWYDDRPWYNHDEKYHPDDAETPMERLNKIHAMCHYANKIHVSHEYLKGDPDNRDRYDNRLYTNKWYGTVAQLLIHPYIEDEDEHKVVIWDPRNNKDRVDNKKSSLSDKQWDWIMRELKSKYPNHVVVDYRMPVEDVFWHIATATLCIGYEGMGNVIAKSFWKPMIIYSYNTKVGRVTSGPWAVFDNKHKKPFTCEAPIGGPANTQLPAIKSAKKRFSKLLKELNDNRSSSN